MNGARRTRSAPARRHRAGKVARAVLTASMLALEIATVRAQGGATASPAPPTRVSSVRNLPGYRPLADPESMSVVVGRRLNAPLVRKPFVGGARSLDGLGRAVCRALHHSAGDSLLNLCIRDDEFRDILWREFPQSRPATGLVWEDAWRILYARLHAGCAHAIRDHGGHTCEFLRFDCDSTAVYRNFRLYSGLTLVVRSDEGDTLRMRWLRSVAEHRGAFKIYSTDD